MTGGEDCARSGAGRGVCARWRLGALASLLTLLVVAGACAGAQAGNGPPLTLRAAGSTSMTPTLRDLAEKYQARSPDTVIDVRGGNSAFGLSDLAAGRADLAAVSWRTKDAAVPQGVQAVAVGRDAVAIIVHPRNRVRGLTLLQIRSLYAGEILDWDALGGTGLEPVIVSREEGSGTRGAFEALVMGGERVTLNALVMPDTRSVVNYVAAHPAAIGYVSAAALDERVRALEVEGVAPTPANLRAGAYHLTRLLYLYAPSPAPPATQAFLDYVLSPAGQSVIAAHHLPLR